MHELERGVGDLKARNKRQIRQTTGKTVLHACIAGVVVLTLGACLIAFLIYSGSVDEGMAQIACKPVLFLAALVTAMISIVKEKSNYILAMTASSLTLYLLLIGINFFLFEGKYQDIFGSTIAYILGVILAACVKIVRWKPGSNSRMKYRFR